MTAKTIWIHVGLVALFAGGIAVGVLYHHHALENHGGGGHGHDSTHFSNHFRKRLDLTDEQSKKVSEVLESLHQEMMGLTKDFREKFGTLRSRAWKDIRATLSEKQRTEFEKLVDELEKNHVPH